MSWTDLMGKGKLLSNWLLCCTLLTFSFLPSLYSSGEAFPATLVCDDQINLALNGNCEGLVTVEMILEGESTIPDFSPLNYDILLEGPNGPVSDMLLLETGLYTVTVVENGTGPAAMNPPFNSCWGHILVEDKLPPSILSCPCEVGNTDPDCVLTILCEDLGDIGGLMVEQPQAIDNCNNNFTVTFTDDIDGVDCATSIVTRTWRLTDTDGNYVTCQSEYRIDPLALTSAITPPNQHVDLDCGTGTTPESVYTFFAAEYRADYPCGGTDGSLCNPLSPNYDEDFVAYYEAAVHQYALMFSYPSINGVKLDGNICNTVTSYSDTVIPICSSEPGCSGNAKIIRTWTIYDWCDPNLEPIKFSQVLKASDTTAPSIDAISFGASVDPWKCSARIIFPDPVTISDNCAQFVSYTVTGSGTSSDFAIGYDPNIGYFANDVPVGEHTFYYNAYDCCDNTTSDGIVVTVADNTPPVAITKQDIVLTLVANPGNTVEQGYSKMWAESVDNGSFDGCGPVKLEIRRETQMCGDSASVTYNNDFHSFDDTSDYDDGRFVTFCCQDIAEYGIDENGDGINDYAQIKVWLRVWDDGDADGEFGTAGDNYSEVWSYVRVEDKSTPIIWCPPDVVIDCMSDSEDLTITGIATADAACGYAGVEYEDETHLSSCNQGYIFRTWTATGYPHISCIQKITVSGTIAGGPVVVTFPRDTIITCQDVLIETPTWNSAPCDMMAYSVDRDTFYFADGACFKVLNYWTVINWCTYNPSLANSPGIWSQVQVVKILDDTAPTFSGCVDQTIDAGAQCMSTVTLTNTAEDLGLCSSDKLSWTVQVDLNGDNTNDYTLSSTAPQLSGLYISPTQSGQEVQITLPEEIAGSMTSHIVTWRVSDGCGNYASCQSSFMVVDNIPPTPYCVNLSTALMQSGQVELWACDFDLGAFDNCSDNDNIRFTFGSVRPQDDPSYNPLTHCSSKIFTCDDLIDAGGAPVTLDVYVWDEKDNYDFCTVFLTLVDNNDSCEDIGNSPSAQIGGQIMTEMGETLEEVDIQLTSAQEEYPLTNQTDNSGHFMFTQNTMGMDYALEPSKDVDHLNGVSTLDLVLMQRHILGLKELDSPFKLVAADINNDETITAIDLLELRKLILGIHTDFPNNKSWRFLDESDILDQNNPWPITEIRTIDNLGNNMMQEDFVGVKIGDVNNNVILNAQDNNDIESRTSKSLVLSYNDVNFEKGETVKMALNLDEITNLSGLQFTLETSNLELISIKEEGLNVSKENFASLNNGIITFSWNAAEMVNEFELFTISFRAKGSGKLSQNVKLSSKVTQSEAYLGKDFETTPIELFGRNNSERTFTLNQNNPNPFNESTNISFVLPESSDATLTVLDVTGRILFSSTNEYDKGFNSIDLSSKDLNITGVLYYKLEAGSMSATKKMIIIK